MFCLQSVFGLYVTHEKKSYHFPIQQEVSGVYKQGGVFSALYEMVL